MDLTPYIQGAAAGTIAYAVASSAAHALPEPTPADGKLYRFFYQFTQGLMSNWDKAKSKQ